MQYIIIYLFNPSRYHSRTIVVLTDLCTDTKKYFQLKDSFLSVFLCVQGDTPRRGWPKVLAILLPVSRTWMLEQVQLIYLSPVLITCHYRTENTLRNSLYRCIASTYSWPAIVLAIYKDQMETLCFVPIDIMEITRPRVIFFNFLLYHVIKRVFKKWSVNQSSDENEKVTLFFCLCILTRGSRVILQA